MRGTPRNIVPGQDPSFYPEDMAWRFAPTGTPKVKQGPALGLHDRRRASAGATPKLLAEPKPKGRAFGRAAKAAADQLLPPAAVAVPSGGLLATFAGPVQGPPPKAHAPAPEPEPDADDPLFLEIDAALAESPAKAANPPAADPAPAKSPAKAADPKAADPKAPPSAPAPAKAADPKAADPKAPPPAPAPAKAADPSKAAAPAPSPPSKASAKAAEGVRIAD